MDSAQQEYEKMNNDMEDALGLLTKLWWWSSSIVQPNHYDTPDRQLPYRTSFVEIVVREYEEW